MRMGVSTLHPSNIRGFAFEFVRALPVWIRPQAERGCKPGRSYAIMYVSSLSLWWGTPPTRGRSPLQSGPTPPLPDMT